MTGLALSGCYLLEDPYDTSPAEEDIDTHTPQANPFATTPPGVCPDRSESLIQIGTMTSRGYVNVSLLPVFAGEPDMSEVTYDELANEYSEEVDPHRALLAIALDSIYSDGFEPDDVTDVRLEPIEREGTWRICNDPLDVEVKYIGTSDPADDYDPAGIWEVTSDEPFYDRGDEVHLQLSLLGTSIEGPADAWYVKRPPRAKGTWESSTMAAAFRDLEFYYNNREN